MTHYRKIDVRIWNDEKFVSLSVHGKMAFVMLLTHPMMTALGAMRGTLGGVADELCCGEEGLREGFLEGLRSVFDKGMAEYDPRASLIALPNFLKYNPPESPNVVKAWVKSAELLPEGDLKNLTVQRAVAYAEAMSKGFREAIPQVFRKAMPKTSPKTSLNQRAESRDEVRHDEGLAPTHTHARDTHVDHSPDEKVTKRFEDKDAAGAWLAAVGAFPGDPAFDRCVDKLVDGTATWADVNRAAA